MIWLALLNIGSGVGAVSQPIPLKGQEAGKASAADLKILNDSGTYVAMSKADACTINIGQIAFTEGDSISGSFTRKGARQRVIASECGVGGPFGYFLIGVVDGSKLVKTYYVEARGISIKKFRDLNMNGTEEILLSSGYGGDGEMGGFISVVDFSEKGTKEYGAYHTELTVCMWDPSHKAADIESNVYATPGIQPKFTADVKSTDCETQKTITSSHKSVKAEGPSLTIIKLR